MTPSPAATFSARLLREFVALGVQHVVVSPGSRSQALALAAATAEERGSISLHVRLDERDAAFTALGLARETGLPALIVTTSGTAAANLLPAVVEASHSGVPMIVLTADRPARLRGTGSNQTTWQPGLFGRFVRAEADVEAPVSSSIPDARAWARWAFATATGAGGGAGAASPAGDAAEARGAGPVHLNLQFVEPLSGTVIDDDDPEAEGEVELLAAEEAADAIAHPGRLADADADADVVGGAGMEADASRAGAGGLARPAASTSVHLPQGPRTLVIAGADAGEAANELALAAGWPLIAEVSSGARFGPTLVGAYRTLLDEDDFGGRVERVVVFGHPTLSRQVPALLVREGVEIVVVRRSGEPVVPRPGVAVVDHVTADPEDRSDRAARAWTGQWVFAGRELLAEEEAADEVAAPLVSAGGPGDLAGSRDFARAELAALRAPITRRSLARAVWQASWPHDRLVLGASRLIRELDAVAPGKRIRVHANRGLAGIDGTIATAVGIALASQLGDRAQAGASGRPGASAARRTGAA
ncbi:2-succinyl-5-enolpyruvyl-6-hydroxy-3-cyclohexene-1-carboxylic-acid synthase, partial [Herbiconiux solani]|uniref:2-succinyl-5-enolpyruvyl-6-hydroxy-3- cyclohexene-1-carboxylic-acid synthase n=1 Tax=Herbiconiux solani TaxID=661329 RepID=UPI0008245A8A